MHPTANQTVELKSMIQNIYRVEGLVLEGHDTKIKLVTNSLKVAMFCLY